ncbi:MAG TPA: GNAT family N-acetyltransferase [Gaiellaceae bacterium]|nr:GNAT family N-acetyltransferase [Gaiellaceae bacterium]
MSILTDLTPAALTSAIEENLFAFFRAIAGLPGGEFVETDELLLHRTGLSSPMFNGVSRTRGVPIEKVTGRFSQPFFWWTGPQSSPGDLDERLEAAGLLDAGRDSPGMAIALADIDEERARPQGVAVEPAQDEPGLQLWGRMFCGAHGAPPAAAQAWVDAARRLGFRDLPWDYWLARIDGDPVGLGLSFLGGGVVGLYGIGTLPAARRRGVGSALTLVPMLEAREKGYAAAILHSTPEGELLYPRLGFHEYCQISRFLGGV